jgi:uncharacterized membrane protein
MTLFKTLFAPVKDGDDVTTQFLSVLAAVALIGGGIIILVMLLNILFPARLHRAEIAVYNQQQLAQIQKYHGAKATRAVVYEADKAYFYNKDGRKVYLK